MIHSQDAVEDKKGQDATNRWTILTKGLKFVIFQDFIPEYFLPFMFHHLHYKNPKNVDGTQCRSLNFVKNGVTKNKKYIPSPKKCQVLSWHSLTV